MEAISKGNTTLKAENRYKISLNFLHLLCDWDNRFEWQDNQYVWIYYYYQPTGITNILFNYRRWWWCNLELLLPFRWANFRAHCRAFRRAVSRTVCRAFCRADSWTFTSANSTHWRTYCRAHKCSHRRAHHGALRRGPNWRINIPPNQWTYSWTVFSTNWRTQSITNIRTISWT